MFAIKASRIIGRMDFGLICLHFLLHIMDCSEPHGSNVERHGKVVSEEGLKMVWQTQVCIVLKNQVHPPSSTCLDIMSHPDELYPSGRFSCCRLIYFYLRMAAFEVQISNSFVTMHRKTKLILNIPDI